MDDLINNIVFISNHCNAPYSFHFDHFIYSLHFGHSFRLYHFSYFTFTTKNVISSSCGFPDAHFDRIVTIDVHEHLDDCTAFSQEVGRIAKPNAQVICTVPNGDNQKVVVKIKNAVGM